MIGYFRNQIQCLNCDVLAALFLPNAMLGLVCRLANNKKWVLFYAVDVIEVNG